MIYRFSKGWGLIFSLSLLHRLGAGEQTIFVEISLCFGHI